jgi:hypothetical protein
MILEHGRFVYSKITSYDDLLILVVKKLAIDIYDKQKIEFLEMLSFFLGASMDTSKIWTLNFGMCSIYFFHWPSWLSRHKEIKTNCLKSN